MKLFVSHLSALRYWRQADGLSTGSRAKVSTLSNAITSTKDVKIIDPRKYGLIMSADHPLHVLVSSIERRRYAKELKPHLWSRDVPAGAFLRIAPNLYVSTPEFAYLQLATSLSLVELAQVGNELCGGYFLLATSGFVERESPITSRSKLTAFVQQNANVRGARKALKALSWVADHCNSPMETNTLLALCLPSRLGGWALRMPEVNKSVPVAKRMRRYVGGSNYTPDFLWEIEVGDKIIRVTAEYDSHEHHDEESDAEHTRIRRNDMKAMGYLVTSINKSQMQSASLFQFPARQIARDLGLYRPVPSRETLKKQNELLRLLARELFR